jgi:hypothetical protein
VARQRDILAYASMDVNSQGYNDRNLYNNHRFKKINQPMQRESCTLRGNDAPLEIRIGARYVKDHSVAPYAYIGNNKMFEDAADLISDDQRRRKAI